MLKLKKQVKEYLLGDWLQGQEVDAKWKSELRETFVSSDMARKKFSAYPDHALPDTAWQVGCPESVSLLADLLDQLVYGDSFDPRFKDAVKSKHAVEDFLAYPSVEKPLANVEAHIRSEKRPPSAGQPQAETSSTGPGAVAASADTETAEAAASAASAAAADNRHSQLTEEEQQQWRQQMLRTLQAHVRFVTDGKNQAELEQNLKDSGLATIKGDNSLGQVLLIFDIKKYGEPLTRPDLRVPTLRESLYNRLVRAVLNARSSEGPGTLGPGDIGLILDGGKQGNKNKFLAPWKEGTVKEGKKNPAEEENDDGEEGDEDEEDCDDKPNLVCDKLLLTYTEESLAARKQRVRGTGTLKQLETALVLTSRRLSLPPRDRKHFPGSTNGDLISGIAWPKHSEEWQVSWKEKKECYGKRHLIAVGGKTEHAGDEGKQGNRGNNEAEPFCYHSAPEAFLEEILHGYYVKSVVDMTPADGKLAFVCLRQRIGYCGICYNDIHAKTLEKRMLQRLQEEMLDPSSPLFSSAYSTALGNGTAETVTVPDPKAKPRPKAKSKGAASKPKAKPKAKPKVKAKAKSGNKRPREDDGDEDQDQEEGESEQGEDNEDENVWDPLNE